MIGRNSHLMIGSLLMISQPCLPMLAKEHIEFITGNPNTHT